MPSILDELHHGWNDHAAWCRECLSIRDTRGVSVPLELWPAQVKLNKAVERQRARGRPVRIVYLKARRVSASVGAAAEMFHRVPFQAGQHGMIVAHDIDSTKEIFDYCEQFQSSYKPFRGVIGLSGVVKDDERKLGWNNDSWIKVQTANNLKAGRGSNLRFLQLDEFAFWRDARTLMTGLMQTVPDDADTIVFVISTANGVGGPFHSLWQEATDPARQSEWIPVFFAWWEHPTARRPLEMRADVFQRTLGKSEIFGDELAERAKYNLTLEQLAWRRWTILNKCQGSVDIFRQEYPGCPEEAFLASGRPRFLHAALGRMAVIRDPLRGRLEWQKVGTREQLIFVPHDQGEIAIYRKPEPGRRYCIGADTATGKDIREGSGSADPDWSVASVIDAATGEQVAKFRARVEEPLFGEILYALGRYFNDAYIVPEANSYGRGVIAELLRRTYPPALIYQRERTPDDQESASLNKIGFLTSEVTRPQLISALDTAIREFSVLIRDVNTLAECLTFVINGRGRPEAQQECHDDEVFALALAVIGLRSMPRARKRVERPQAQTAVAGYGGRRLHRRDRRNEAELD